MRTLAPTTSTLVAFGRQKLGIDSKESDRIFFQNPAEIFQQSWPQTPLDPPVIFPNFGVPYPATPTKRSGCNLARPDAKLQHLGRALNSQPGHIFQPVLPAVPSYQTRPTLLAVFFQP
ncbi:hypothetical protein GBA52_015864 [Prunus armeniaca]|nr:hypothetical protein GBA52_015864 [Prunus armeniaca]